MGLNVFRSNRRIIASVALLGVTLYAALIPFHMASRFVASLAEAELSAALTVICHAGGSTTSDDGALPPGSDEQSTATCTLCQALSGLQLAAVATILLGLITPPEHKYAVALTDIAAPDHTTQPRSRGPPATS